MEHGAFAQDFFCRLCASDGVVIHPLFPPGDDDPKDELVRMIEVLTSVHLSHVDDAGAVICDKCLQMLDLFCKFREEALRQDVLIRTRRSLLSEELEKQQLQISYQQQEQLLQQQAELLQPEIKLEHEDVETDNVEPAIALGSEEIVCMPTPPFIGLENCIEKLDEKDEGPFLISDEVGVRAAVGVEAQLQQYHDTLGTVYRSGINENACNVPGMAVFPQTGSISISMQVNQMPLEEVSTISNETVMVVDAGKTSPAVLRRRQRKGKPNFKKPPPACEHCNENFDTYYEYDQHMNQHHDWDRSNRCSLACDPCQMRFTKSYNLKRHLYEVHGEVPHGLTVIPCEHCGEQFLRGNILERHIARVHSNKKKTQGSAIKAI